MVNSKTIKQNLSHTAQCWCESSFRWSAEVYLH